MNQFHISNLVLTHQTFLSIAANEKSNIPSKGDAIHTLKRISQNGKRFTALQGKKITTVKHLMREYHKDKSALQKVTQAVMIFSSIQCSKIPAIDRSTI
jgi:hypothetical protein